MQRGYSFCTHFCAENDLMLDAFRLPVVWDFLDLFSHFATVIHVPLFQSDEGRCHPLPVPWRQRLRQFQDDFSILDATDFSVCRSLPAQRRQALLMLFFDVQLVHTVFLAHRNHRPSSLSLDQTIPHRWASLVQSHRLVERCSL